MIIKPPTPITKTDYTKLSVFLAGTIDSGDIFKITTGNLSVTLA